MFWTKRIGERRQTIGKNCFNTTEQKPTYIFHCLFLRMLVFETTATFSLIFAFHTLNGVILSSCKGKKKKNNLEIQI